RLVLDPGCNVDGRRVHDVSHVEAAREGGAHRVHLGDEDTRAGCGRVERRESTDRAGTGDEHGVTGADAGDVDAVGGHGPRLDEGTLQVADFVGEHTHVAGRDDGELGDATPVVA